MSTDLASLASASVDPASGTAPSAVPGRRRAQVLAVTSGKGGVGKTFFSANLAAGLAARGAKVLVLDADLGLANLDVVLNLTPKLTLHDVFTGNVPLDDVILQAPGGFSVVLAGSGLVEYSRLTPEVRDRLQACVASLIPRYDYVLLDTGAGISDVVLYTVSLAAEVVVVATPEPTSLTDAYATIKVLASQQHRTAIRLVINQSTKPGQGKAIRTQLQNVIDRFVTTSNGAAVKLEYLGEVPHDQAVRTAVQRRLLLVEAFPGSEAGMAIGAIAAKLAPAH